ncbi:MAG: hypothetical protein FJ109_20285 [Deltaproteobacteria bacterium]|nr:hypothetical protein [Deltaproteobacteria bacterium]
MHPRLTSLSPEQTKLWSMLDEVRGDSISPEWMQVTLGAIDVDNAFADAADYSFTDGNVPSRIQNVCRIQRKTVKLAGASLVDRTFSAVGKLKMQQMDVRLRELKRDLNHAAWNSQLKLENELTERRTKGLWHWLSGSSNIDNSGVALTELLFKQTMLKGVYDDNFEATDVFISPVLQNVVDNFFTATKPGFMDGDGQKFTSYINKYVSPWSSTPVNLHTERSIYFDAQSGGGESALYTADDATHGQCVAIQRDMFKKYIFRPLVMIEPEPHGDYWEGVYQIDWGIQALASGLAGFALTNKTPS